VCSEGIGGPAKLAKSLSYFFSSHFFRTEMPVTGDLYERKDLGLQMINIWEDSVSNSMGNIALNVSSLTSKSSILQSKGLIADSNGTAAEKCRTSNIGDATIHAVTNSHSSQIDCTQEKDMHSFNDDAPSVSVTNTGKPSSEVTFNVKEEELKPTRRPSKLMKKRKSISNRQELTNSFGEDLPHLDLNNTSEKVQHLSELFEWNIWTAESIKEQIVSDNEIIVTPFSCSMELILKYWDAFFVNKNEFS
jgi:hypothetical protein